jgi:hypothetical protein
MTCAQDPALRVRGTIDRVEGHTYIVSARAGQVQVKLADNPLVVAVTKAALAEITPGSYVGVSAMPQADGSQKALEVHIFPESMRGVGDGLSSTLIMATRAWMRSMMCTPSIIDRVARSHSATTSTSTSAERIDSLLQLRPALDRLA